MPASAETSVINIQTSEQITRHDTYQPNADYTDGTVTAGAVSGSGTVVLTNTAGIPLNDVVIVFNAGQTSGWAQAGSDTVTASVTGTGPVTVSIKTFPVDGVVHLTYQLTSSATPAITLSATYTKNNVVNSDTDSTTIHLTATNNAGVAVTPTISIVPADSTTLGTLGTPDWTLSSTSGGVSPGAGDSLDWAPGEIAAGATTAPVNILATVNEPAALDDGINDVSLYDMATSTVTYTVSGSCAGVSVASATGKTSEVVSTINKRLTNGNWVFTPEVSVPTTSEIAYDLTSVSVWAVDGSTLNPIAGESKTINSGTLPTILDGSATSSWAATGTQVLEFAYSSIPVGFMKPEIGIRNTNNQFPVTSTSTPDGVDLLKKIYVINGYEVEVVKTVTPSTTTEGEYHINIVATNHGSKATPPHVYVYDIVPSLFYAVDGFGTVTSPFNVVPGFDGHTGITGGEAFYWDMGALAAGASKTIDYDVSGTGDYLVADLYVVGVDPAQSLNLQTTPLLSNASVLINSNFETLAALGAAGLLVVGMIGTARRRS